MLAFNQQKPYYVLWDAHDDVRFPGNPVDGNPSQNTSASPSDDDLISGLGRTNDHCLSEQKREKLSNLGFHKIDRWSRVIQRESRRSAEQLNLAFNDF
jgi:hypothetical protein